MEEDAAPSLDVFGFFDFDPDYEFDAPRFFDFSFPESQSDINVAESWFLTASSYPPSPFVIELMWNEGFKEAHYSNTSRVFEHVPSSNSPSIVSNTTGCLSAQDVRQIGLTSLKPGVKKAQPRPTVSKGSTLMKPTASHLAKISQRKEVSKSVSPPANSLKNNEKNLQNSVNQNQATKRQKLESGYLRKVAHLNHQTVFAHKKTTKVSHHLGKNSIDPKKVTIPREPKLETARRALIRSSGQKDTVLHDHDTESTTHSFKAHQLNKKILKTPLVPLRKRTATPLFPEFQEFHLKTSEQALQQFSENAISMPESISISQTGSTSSERSSCANSPTRQRNESAQSIHDKETIPSMGKKNSPVPPVELFSKLSLISERQNDASQPKLQKTTRA